MKVTVIPTVICALGAVTKGFVKRQEELEIRGWEEISQTTALLRLARILRRVLIDLRRLTVTQTPVEDHQLMLVWKTLKEEFK